MRTFTGLGSFLLIYLFGAQAIDYVAVLRREGVAVAVVLNATGVYFGFRRSHTTDKPLQPTERRRDR